VGRIPWLLAAGYTGPIICSRPSAKLLPLVLEDAFKLGISRDRQLLEQYLATIVETIGDYSAHAEQQGLVEFVAGMKEKLKDIRLVHGEEHANQALREKLKALAPCGTEPDFTYTDIKAFSGRDGLEIQRTMRDEW